LAAVFFEAAGLPGFACLAFAPIAFLGAAFTGADFLAFMMVFTTVESFVFLAASARLDLRVGRMLLAGLIL
jgi:hypothetical protein